VSLKQTTISAKIFSLFLKFEIRFDETSKKEFFSKSRAWFDPFRKRVDGHNVRHHRQGTCDDPEATKNFPGKLAEIIGEARYCL
jgi:hypothetical protein